MRKLCFILSILFTHTYLTQAQTINWLSQHQLGPGSDYYQAVTYDNAGFAYSTGFENNSALSGCTGRIIVSRHDATGGTSYSSPYTPLLANGICDEAGSAILYHPGSAELIIGGKENSQAFLGFFDAATGTFLNKASITSTSSEVKGLFLQGNTIYAVGYFRNTITFGGSSPITLSGSSQYNVFLAKFDQTGNVLQAIKASGTGSTQAIGFDIEVDFSGDIYISVAANGNITFDGSSTFPITGSGYKLLIFQLDAAMSLSSGTTVGTSPFTVGVDEEIPIQLDWSNNSLLVAAIHQNQQESFLTKLDITGASPAVDYSHKLINRVVRDLSLDCNNVYLTGYKGQGKRQSAVEKKAIPCSLRDFLFFDTHELGTGLQTMTKQASGCTFGEGLVVDQQDNIWLNGYFGDPASMTFESLSQSFSPNGRNGLISKFTADSTCVKETKFCCPGENLVVNGDFESGNTGFSSGYMYQGGVGPGSIVPGQYGVINGGQAASISPTWSAIQDPSTCSNSSGNFLIVNGENGGGPIPAALSNSIPPTKVVWEQNFTVQDWRGYKFCLDAKNLDQCGFNVAPKLEVQFSMPFGNITQTISTGVGACDWQQISAHLDLWGYGTALNIKIVLDQNEFGDGNDVAIDNIALIPVDKCPAASAEFDVQTSTPHPTDPTAYSITATADIVPPCEAVWWEVCEYDPFTGDCVPGTKLNSIWWTAITNFPGYVGTNSPSGAAPGIFEFGKFYRITRGTWGACNSWISSATIVHKASAARKAERYKESEFEQRRQRFLQFLLKQSKE